MRKLTGSNRHMYPLLQITFVTLLVGDPGEQYTTRQFIANVLRPLLIHHYYLPLIFWSFPLEIRIKVHMTKRKPQL